ncbi:MAG: Virus attachment protein p12 family protein [Lachnoclostridium sp.]|jgi:hypothetical protein
MCCNKNSDTPVKTTSNVHVDVTKIVKYVCMAGVFIVAIIFITNCISNILSKHD